MTKYKSNTSKETINQAESIAKATQRPGQTKEQTKLIAQGIQKGIEQYKKQHKVKARELDKKLKTIKSKALAGSVEGNNTGSDMAGASKKSTSSALPWLLLIISWISFSVFWYIKR